MNKWKLALISLATAYAAGYFVSLEPNVMEWNAFGRYAVLVVACGIYFWTRLVESTR